MYGTSSSSQGTGVYGTADSIGVHGTSNQGLAIRGDQTHPEDSTITIAGFNQSSKGTALFGQTLASDGVTIAVHGRSQSGNGFDFYADGNGTDYGSASSRRWKTNIEDIESGLELLDQLRGVRYTWDEEHGGNRDIGFIAEEVGEILPEIVNYDVNGVDAIAMDYSKITPVLVQAMKEMRKEYLLMIEELKEQNHMLKSQLIAAELKK